MQRKFPNFSFSNSRDKSELEHFLISAGLSKDEIKRVFLNYWKLNKYYKNCSVVGHFFKNATIYGENTPMVDVTTCYRITRFASILFSSIKPNDENSVKVFNLRKDLILQAFAGERNHYKIIKGLRDLNLAVALHQVKSPVQNGDDAIIEVPDKDKLDRNVIFNFYSGIHMSLLSSMVVMLFKNGMKLRYNTVLSSRQSILLSLAILEAIVYSTSWSHLIFSLLYIDKDKYRRLCGNFLSGKVNVPKVINCLIGGDDYDM